MGSASILLSSTDVPKRVTLSYLSPHLIFTQSLCILFRVQHGHRLTTKCAPHPGFPGPDAYARYLCESQELTSGYISESQSIDRPAMGHLRSRLARRHLKQMNCGAYQEGRCGQERQGCREGEG